jgi:hypothetical protein
MYVHSTKFCSWRDPSMFPMPTMFVSRVNPMPTTTHNT